MSFMPTNLLALLTQLEAFPLDHIVSYLLDQGYTKAAISESIKEYINGKV